MPSPRPTAHLTALVQRDQCRPDLLCIACREPIGDRHKLLCSMWKSAVKTFRATTNGRSGGDDA